MELSQDLPTLKRLWDVAERAAAVRPDSVADYVFLPIGLRLHIPPAYGDYYCTPTNSSFFAGTGGDGVHFSFVHLEGKISEESPIVMTVPLGIHENVIVGSDLVDFLRLGCICGYFALEGLGYDRKLFWNDVFDGEDLTLLPLLIDEFSLTPWENVEQHLDDLHQQFFPLLKLPSRP